MPKITILILVDYYLPGYKAGGPIQSIANMVDKLGDEFQLKIVTADRDLEDTKTYPGIKVDSWNRVGKANVFYMLPKRRSLSDFKRLLCSTEYDILYLNSFFSFHFTIKSLLLRRLRLVPNKPLIVAPRGEFSPGALGLKCLKKRVYIAVANLLGLYKGAFWQASSKHEVADVQQWFGSGVKMVIAPDLPHVVNEAEKSKIVKFKTMGCLKIIFLSRISRKKNLDGALKMLKQLKGDVQFNIYGPIEDKVYWAECQKIYFSLPENIKIMYCGSVTHDKVSLLMKEHDLFFFPTLGENFGHVILEAFCAGCPVLISDQTPWRDLEDKGVGWDLPLSKPEVFMDVIQRCIDMDYEEYVGWSKMAWEYGLNLTKDDGVVEKNRELFKKAVEGV